MAAAPYDEQHDEQHYEPHHEQPHAQPSRWIHRLRLCVLNRPRALGMAALLFAGMTALGGCRADLARSLDPLRFRGPEPTIDPRGRTSSRTTAASDRGRRSDRGRTNRPRRVTSGKIELTDRDLAPMDAFIDAGAEGSRTRWILADHVEIVASKEYFAQNLTITAHHGLVRRTDRTRGEDEFVEMRYLGHAGGASAQSCPRVLLGTGISVLARKRLIVHMRRTRDPDMPVLLKITARGEASYGHRAKSIKDGDVLQLGGAISRWKGRWAWRRWGDCPR